ncbi:MAG: DUF2059 domain-containing protein [Pseudomonadota bacterium]
MAWANAKAIWCATAVALTLLASTAWGQTAESEALAADYVAMPEVQQMMDDMFSPGSMGAQFAAGLPNSVSLSDAQEAEVGVLLSEVMMDFRPRLETLMRDATAKFFTAEEISALIAFYKSEHGAAVMSKMQPMMTEVMGEMMPELQSRTQAVLPQLMQIIQGN